MSWPLVVGVGAAGILVGLGLNALADAEARRRPDARRVTRVRGRWPAVVAATAGTFAGAAAAFGFHLRLAAALVFCAALIAIAAIDVEQYVVPNRIVLPAAVAVLAAQTAIDPAVEWAVAAAGAAAFFLVAALAYPAGMGMGDVKLALLLGAMLGAAVSVGVAIALLASLVPAVVILARRGARGRKVAIPFAPFLALGGLVALYAGRELLRGYLHLLG